MTVAPLLGLVRAVQANYYRVRLGQPYYGIDELLCVRRSRLKKIGQHVYVGDWVEVSHPDWQGQRGAISNVLPRRNQLQRPAIANVEQVLLLFALADPEPDALQMTRFLITAEVLGVEILVGLTKADLVSDALETLWRDRLRSWGYNSYGFSITAGQQWQALLRPLSNKVTVVCGPSGVGKSSLIRHLHPDGKIRVGAISEHWHKGQHTTRHVELFPLPTGGWIADTPGFNQPELLAITPQQLAQAFPEIRQRSATQPCQFDNCRHHQEPNCAVRGNWERYPLYLSCLAELEAIKNYGVDTAPHSKTKTDRHGAQHQEPLLDPKKYRRRSRRQQHQQLTPLDTEEEVMDV
ncbi:small ribosomal subunit biogenesis GTPase RsgA [Parathermosynechococcus lividus]